MVSWAGSGKQEGGSAIARIDTTYVQVSLRVKVKSRIMTAKHKVLGSRAVTRRNLANSREDQARSR